MSSSDHPSASVNSPSDAPVSASKPKRGPGAKRGGKGEKAVKTPDVVSDHPQGAVAEQKKKGGSLPSASGKGKRTKPRVFLYNDPSTYFCLGGKFDFMMGQQKSMNKMKKELAGLAGKSGKIYDALIAKGGAEAVHDRQKKVEDYIQRSEQIMRAVEWQREDALKQAHLLVDMVKAGLVTRDATVDALVSSVVSSFRPVEQPVKKPSDGAQADGGSGGVDVVAE